MHTYPLTAIQLLHAKKNHIHMCKTNKNKNYDVYIQQNKQKTLEEEDEELINI